MEAPPEQRLRWRGSLNDTVLLNDREWFIHGRREKGSFVLRDVAGSKKEIVPSKLCFVRANHGILIAEVR